MNAIQTPHPDAIDYFVRKVRNSPSLSGQDHRSLFQLAHAHSMSINRFLTEYNEAQNGFNAEIRRATAAFEEGRKEAGTFHVRRLENLCETYPFLETTRNISRFHDLAKQSSVTRLWMHGWKQAVTERTGYTFEAPLKHQQ